MSSIGHNNPPSASIIRDVMDVEYSEPEVHALLISALDLLGESNEQLRTLNACMTVMFMELGKPGGPDRTHMAEVRQQYLDWTRDYLTFGQKFQELLSDLADCRTDS